MKTRKLQGRELASGLSFPEGPVVMQDGSLLIVEIAAGNLTRIWSGGRSEVVAKLGGGPNGLAIGPDGLAYVCNNGGLTWVKDVEGLLRPVGTPDDYSGGRVETVNLTTGRVDRVFDRCGPNPLRGPNDIVFDQSGGFWFTDLGKAFHRQLDRGSVFYAMSGGAQIKEMIFPISLPNGIGLSPSQSELYIAETETARLWTFEVEGPGRIKKDNWPSPNGGRQIYGRSHYGRFDSLAVEACGNICVATLIDSGISVISPAGDLVEFWETTDPYCTNICFGGPDMTTAFVTLSGFGTVIAVDWPRPGAKLAF